MYTLYIDIQIYDTIDSLQTKLILMMHNERVCDNLLE